MKLLTSLVFSTALTLPCAAQDMLVTVEIPRLEVAEYHAPYLAMWLEGTGGDIVNLAVWYDVDQAKDEGETWLKDIRQWWRKIGRETEMPVDGVSGPTRPPGQHEIVFGASRAQLNAIPAGAYEFVIEAAREVGEREILRILIEWPLKSGDPLEIRGERELGLVTIAVKP